ncbi:MAG TPA: hypothetical protein VH228_11265 [Nocardioides sp.]|nr:hypothetical protein [Nocardioides sp.]
MDRTAYDAWRALPFPSGSSVDEVDEAHADLAYWDAMTAETVVPMVERASAYDPGVLDFPSGLAALRDRLLVLREAVSDSEADVLGGYVEYVDALVAVNRWAADESR